jgi:hypothetical protein
MHGHLYLANIGARLRSAGTDGLPGEPPEEIKALIEQLQQREMIRKAREEACSDPPPSASRRAGG